MNQYVTGAVIRKLREKNHFTQAESVDEQHSIVIECIEDEYFVQIAHEMSKEHYISFLAAVSSGGIQMVKLYPEGAAQGRFKIRGVKKIYAYCNKDGLYYVDVPCIRGMKDEWSK